MNPRHWTAIISVIFLTGCTAYDSIDRKVYSPPVGWIHWQSRIPYIIPEVQRGKWIHGWHTIYLAWWTKSGANSDPTKNPRSFDQSKNTSYSDFRLDFSRMISICGHHPALMQAFHATWSGNSDAIVEVYTRWGTTVYWVQYVRPASERASQAAIESLKTLCAGAPGAGMTR